MNTLQALNGCRGALAALAVAAGMLITGCGSTSYPEVAASERAAQPDYQYVVGPGDTMEIFVWGNEELTTGGVVRPDGKLTTRLVEDLQASGKTSTQLGWRCPRSRKFLPPFPNLFKLQLTCRWHRSPSRPGRRVFVHRCMPMDCRPDAEPVRCCLCLC